MRVQQLALSLAKASAAQQRYRTSSGHLLQRTTALLTGEATSPASLLPSCWPAASLTTTAAAAAASAPPGTSSAAAVATQAAQTLPVAAAQAGVAMGVPAQPPAAAAAAAASADPGRPAHHCAPEQVSWHGAGRFTNPWPTWTERPFKDLWRWSQERRRAGRPATGWLTTAPNPTPADFAAAFPVHALDYDALAAPPADAVQAVWVGHATLLVQLGGVTFLTDPVLSARCSPVQWAGPKRVVAAPLVVEEPRLPQVDFVVISHNHYDHLDTASVRRLRRRFGDKLTWYVPLGLAAWFRGEGVRSVVELDWWQSRRHPGTDVDVTLTPAQHWSSRRGWDRRGTLWGSWAVTCPATRFWFGGDTGYCPVFPEIGERLGPFDLAAIPIGAYEPRWFMAPQHIDPAEAVRIHAEVRSARSIGIHTATFCLTDEALDEPPARLPREAAAAGLGPRDFVMLQHGAMLATARGADRNAPPLLGGRALH